MDLIFNCPKCNQELEVDDSGAGEEIDCPSCGERIRIPSQSSAAATATVPKAVGGTAAAVAPPQPAVNAIAASAAAKVERHLKVPVHARHIEENLIAKPLPPLEVAAKETDRRLRVKCIRHVDCVEVGHDKFDEVVTNFLEKIGELNLVSITTISYSHIDISSQKLLTDYGVMIVYKG
jgi:DNA-directed RNA polymerase subunit RPC12/RpoP